MSKGLSRYIIPLLITLWIVLLLPAAGLAAQPALTITGTGLHHDVQISGNDWSKYSLKECFYSSNNNFNYHKIWKVKGYDIFALIGDDNLKTDKDYEVTFVSGLDGGKVTRTVSELQSQYYHPKFTASGAEPVAPMLSFYRTAVFEPDHQLLPEPTEVIWQDRALTENDSDEDKPRLVMGQSLGQVSQNNQSFFNKKVDRILVGGERPAGESSPKKNPEDGGTTSGKDGPKESSNPPASVTDPKKDKDPEKATEREDKPDGSDEKDGETAEDEGIEEETAGGLGGEKNLEVGLTDEQPRKPRWPWIAAGAVVVAGAVGGGAYYYIRRRGNLNK